MTKSELLEASAEAGDDAEIYIKDRYGADICIEDVTVDDDGDIVIDTDGE